ncbi:hypothetical protein IMZ48_44380 [Candidatus Bathyarchaeota archaeon]|nr:hypothetical protein [Candidatus Bathyarchaeota archaeon]
MPLHPLAQRCHVESQLRELRSAGQDERLHSLSGIAAGQGSSGPAIGGCLRGGA